MEVNDLRRLMNTTNNVIHVKAPAIPTTNPALSPAMREVGAGESEVETGTMVHLSFPVREINYTLLCRGWMHI